MFKHWRIWLASAGLLVSLGMPVQAEDDLPAVELVSTDNLDSDAELAREKQVPILIMFSMDHCPYCNMVEEDFLKPMMRNSEYESKVLIRKVRIDASHGVVDFNGRWRDPDEISDDYNVSIVPTVIMVDYQGKALSKRIMGLANKYYYGAELDEAIDRSLQLIRSVASK